MRLDDAHASRRILNLRGGNVTRVTRKSFRPREGGGRRSRVAHSGMESGFWYFFFFFLHRNKRFLRYISRRGQRGMRISKNLQFFWFKFCCTLYSRYLLAYHCPRDTSRPLASSNNVPDNPIIITWNASKPCRANNNWLGVVAESNKGSGNRGSTLASCQGRMAQNRKVTTY